MNRTVSLSGIILCVLGGLASPLSAQNPKTEFDIDGTSHTKRIGTTTKEESNTLFTLATPVPEEQQNNFDVEAVVQFTDGCATGNAALLDAESQGMNWTAAAFGCSTKHTFCGQIELPSTFLSTTPYTWRTKFFGVPCGSGGAPDHWYIHGLQHMLHADLDVDSDNNGSIEGSSAQEDAAENEAGTSGKLFGVNQGDANTNGVPDMLEVGKSGAFLPIELQLKTAVPLQDLAVRFRYNGAALGTTNGAMRLWKKNGTDLGRASSDFILPDTNDAWTVGYTPSALGFTASDERRTFYLEGVQPGAQEIAVEMAYSNASQTVNYQTGRQDQIAKDAVRVTWVRVDIATTAQPGNILCVGLTNTYTAVVTPALTGDYAWSALHPDHIGFVGSPNQSTAVVTGQGVSAALDADPLKVEFRPTSVVTCKATTNLTVIGVELTPAVTNVCWSRSDSVTISVVNSFVPNGITWSGTNGLKVISVSDTALVFTPTNSTPAVYTVKATATGFANCFDTSIVTVLKVEIKKVEFTSDHGVLTDYTNNFSGAGGTVFNPRGWIKGGANNPITQTKDTKLTANVTLCVQPSGITYDLTGDGFLGYYTFHKNGQTSSGSDQTLSLTADAKLPAQADVLTHSIDWSMNAGGLTCTAESSGPHKVYVTWGNPGTGPTLKRIDWTCNIGKPANSITAAAEKFRDAIGADPGYAPNPNDNVWNLDSWQFLDSGSYGDCITLAKLARVGLEMIGIPADHCWSYPTADGTAGFPAVSGNSCRNVTTKVFQYQGESFNAKLVYPGNNFEGFFTVSDPGIKAYTVYTEGGPFENQTYYYLEVLRFADGSLDQFWVWDGTQTKNGITVTNWVEVPGEAHIPVPAVP